MTVANLIDGILRDFRFAGRSFRKSLGYTAIAILSLALGIGAATAIFSVVYGVLINPYPYSKPNEIWAPEIHALKTQQQSGPYTVAEFQQLAQLPAFSEVMATRPESMLLTGDRAPENLRTIRVSGGAFHFIGVAPILGRGITQADIRSDGEAEPVAVLSFGAWKRLFNSEPSALGKTLRLNDQPYTVIGVMPSRFGWWTDDGVWLPMPRLPRDDWAAVITRLVPAVSKQQAEQQLHALNLRLAQENPGHFPKDGFRTSLTNYMDMTVASGEMQSSLRLLFGAVGFLLLIACANVASLQLAVATARAREIAVRMSIGAGRGRVIQQLLSESVLLSLVGGALGVLLAFGATKAIAVLMPPFFVPNEARITINIPVLVFSTAASVLTGILFGLAPALQCSRPDLTDALKDASRGAGASRGSGRTRNLLVIVEVALSVILLVGAGLVIRSLLALHQVNVGFQAERVLMVGVPLHPQRYSTVQQRNTFAQNLLDRVKSLPGVEAVAMGNGGMPFGGPQSPYSIEGHPQIDNRSIIVGLISEDYLRTMGIALQIGRPLSEQEILHSDHVALINVAASHLWPAGESPIGKRLRIDFLDKSPGPQVLMAAGATPYVTIEGVIADTKNNGLKEPPAPAVFVPYTLLAPPQRTLAVRTKGDPNLLLNAVRQQLRALDKDQPLGRPVTMQEVLGFQTAQPRFTAALFSSFAMLGLSLAMAGIFSVLSYQVTRRTHEIGVRMALGAQPGNVLGLMLGMGTKLVLIGLGAGLAGSLFLTRFLRSQLFQVAAIDPISIVAVMVLLSAAALLACYIPARRAAGLNPVTALRHE